MRKNFSNRIDKYSRTPTTTKSTRYNLETNSLPDVRVVTAIGLTCLNIHLVQGILRCPASLFYLDTYRRHCET
jgi:hypothetical protein